MAAVSPARDEPGRAAGDEVRAAPLSRVAVVYNERSGFWLTQPEGAAAARLGALSAAHGVELLPHPLDRGDIGESIDRALAARPGAIFVSGGDGTINAVVKALGPRRIALGVIPSGTMNLLARDLGMPLDFEAAVEALLDAEPTPMDLAWVNGEPFLCHSMIGLMPHIARVREQTRGQGGRWRLSPRVLRKSWWLLRTYPRLGVELVTAQGTLRLRTRAITVSNNPLREGTAPIPKRDRIDGGRLGIYVLRDRSRWGLFRLAWKILTGTWHEDRDVVAYESESLVIDLGSRRPITVSHDGETMQLDTPLRYSIAPGALLVLKPRARPAAAD